MEELPARESDSSIEGEATGNAEVRYIRNRGWWFKYPYRPVKYPRSNIKPLQKLKRHMKSSHGCKFYPGPAHIQGSDDKYQTYPTRSGYSDMDGKYYHHPAEL
jgi:hypothetical protein